MRTAACAVTLLLFLFCSASAEDPAGWKAVTSENGAAPTSTLLSIAARAYSFESATGKNGRVRYLEQGVAVPVIKPDGTELGLVSLAAIAGAAIGAELLVSGKHAAWQLDGRAATALLDDAGKQLELAGVPKSCVADAPGCPYFEEGAAGPTPPSPGKPKMIAYWLNAGTAKRIEGPELAYPKYAWGGKHMLLTTKGRSWLFTDGAVKEVFEESGKQVMLLVSQTCDDYVLASEGTQLYYIDGDRLKKVAFPERAKVGCLFKLGDELLMWLDQSNCAVPEKGGALPKIEVKKLTGGKAEATSYSKTFVNRTATSSLMSDGDVAVISIADPQGTKVLAVFRGGKVTKVPSPDKASLDAVQHLAPGPGDYSTLVMFTSEGLTLYLLSTDNKLTRIKCSAEAIWNGLDATSLYVGKDGLYWNRTDEKGATRLLFHPGP